MISIIIPTYNEEKALPKTLQALLSQPGEFETILVDGGSTDRTRAVVADHISLTQHSVLSTVQLITAPKGRAFLAIDPGNPCDPDGGRTRRK